MLREFKTPDSIDVIFDFPVHRITNDLKEAKPMGGSDNSINSKRGNAAKGEKAEEKYERLQAFVDNWDDIKPEGSRAIYPTMNDAVKYFETEKGFSAASLRRWIDAHDDLQIINGMICKPEKM